MALARRNFDKNGINIYLAMQVISMSDEATVAKEFNRLIGRLCGLIESWGLDERQERGAIQTLKSLSYDSQKVIVDLLKEKSNEA
jgi:hypothetical protein